MKHPNYLKLFGFRPIEDDVWRDREPPELLISHSRSGRPHEGSLGQKTERAVEPALYTLGRVPVFCRNVGQDVLEVDEPGA